jgi:hypothetical protein
MDGKLIDFPNATIIEGNDEMRARKCLQIIQNTLKMYRCVLAPQIIMTGPQIESAVKVFAIPDKQEADGKQ